MQSLLSQDVIGYGIYSYLSLDELRELSFTGSLAKDIYLQRLHELGERLVQINANKILQNSEMLEIVENLVLGDNPNVIIDFYDMGYGDHDLDVEILKGALLSEAYNILQTYPEKIVSLTLNSLKEHGVDPIQVAIEYQPLNLEEFLQPLIFGENPIHQATDEQVMQLLDIYDDNLEALNYIGTGVMGFKWGEFIRAIHNQDPFEYLTTDLNLRLVKCVGKLLFPSHS